MPHNGGSQISHGVQFVHKYTYFQMEFIYFLKNAINRRTIVWYLFCTSVPCPLPLSPVHRNEFQTSVSMERGRHRTRRNQSETGRCSGRIAEDSGDLLAKRCKFRVSNRLISWMKLFHNHLSNSYLPISCDANMRRRKRGILSLEKTKKKRRFIHCLRFVLYSAMFRAIMRRIQIIQMIFPWQKSIHTSSTFNFMRIIMVATCKPFRARTE